MSETVNTQNPQNLENYEPVRIFLYLCLDTLSNHDYLFVTISSHANCVVELVSSSIHMIRPGSWRQCCCMGPRFFSPAEEPGSMDVGADLHRLRLAKIRSHFELDALLFWFLRPGNYSIINSVSRNSELLSVKKL